MTVYRSAASAAEARDAYARIIARMVVNGATVPKHVLRDFAQADAESSPEKRTAARVVPAAAK